MYHYFLFVFRRKSTVGNSAPERLKEMTTPPNYRDLVRQQSADPTSCTDWCPIVTKKFVCWLMLESKLDGPQPPLNVRQDIVILNALLTCGAFDVQERLPLRDDGHFKTVLEVAQEKQDTDMIRHLVRRGAV